MSVARPERQVERTKGGKFQSVCVVCLADAQRQRVSCTPGAASLSSGTTKTPRVQKNTTLRILRDSLPFHQHVLFKIHL